MIRVTETADGCLLPVRAQPGARKTAIRGVHQGALKVSVTAPPEDGRANQAVAEALREALGVRRSQIELVKGVTSRDKQFLVRGLTAAELAARLAGLLDE